MEVEFSLSLEDFVALAEYHLRRRSEWQTLLFLGLIILGTGDIGLLLAQFVKDPGIVFWLITAGAAISACLMYCLGKRRIDRWIKRELAQRKNARFLEPSKLTISPEGISHSSADSAGMTMWTAIEKIAVTKDHAFFYLTTIAAHILPRRAFANDHEFTDFVETAQRYFEAANKESVPA
jgi:hypothetical protein